MEFSIRTLGSFSNMRYGKMPDKKNISNNGKYPIFSGYRVVGYCDECNLSGQQLVIVARGVGGTGDVKLSPGTCYLTNLSIAVLVDKNVALKEYLYYYFSKNNLRYLDSGSAQSQITISDLKNVEIPLPPLDIQKKVVSILHSFDAKIANNEAINDNLEQQASALYGKFFPYAVTDELPAEWRVGTVGEIIEIHDSKRIPLSGAQRAKMEKRIYPYYGAASLMDYVDKYIFDGKYLLLGEDGTVVDNSGYPVLQYVWGQFWVNNHAHILTGKLGFNVESLLLLFKRTPVKSIVTGAVQPKISQANLRSIQVAIPPQSKLDEFNELIRPLFVQIRQNQEQNKSLAALRDTLLPKLMSGEIDVSNVQL